MHRCGGPTGRTASTSAKAGARCSGRPQTGTSSRSSRGCGSCPVGSSGSTTRTTFPPDLPERLVAAGLEPEDEETVVVAEAASIPPPSPDLELREDVEAFVALAERIFGRRQGTGFPKDAVPVVACVDGQPVSGGRVDLDPGVDFAGLFGGVTLPEFRGRGLYKATVARRAELARERGYRWLYVDALPTSRPILERLGFVKLTTTRPYVIPRAAD